MNTEKLLLAQIRTYLALAKSMKSAYYLNRARVTLELLHERRFRKAA